MKLKVAKRTSGKKSELNRIRHEGNIPATLYGGGQKSQDVEVDGVDFATALRTMEKGRLPTTVFEIEVDGKKAKAIVKDVQYHKTTYKPLHIDLYVLNDKTEVTVNVPVEYSGVAECSGIKLGGFLRQVMRQVKVRCLPKNLPGAFTLDIRELNLKQSKRVGDLDFPKGVTPLVGEKNVVVVIAK